MKSSSAGRNSVTFLLIRCGTKFIGQVCCIIFPYMVLLTRKYLIHLSEVPTIKKTKSEYLIG